MIGDGDIRDGRPLRFLCCIMSGAAEPGGSELQLKLATAGDRMLDGGAIQLSLSGASSEGFPARSGAWESLLQANVALDGDGREPRDPFDAPDTERP